MNKFLAKSGLALLIGGIDQKENPLLEVDEDIIRKLQDCIDVPCPTRVPCDVRC